MSAVVDYLIELLAAALPFLKAFFVVMFAMNLGVVLTWVDRRQGAMIQDRVGPDRAVIWLPRRVAQALAFMPAAAVALLAVGLAWQDKMERAAAQAPVSLGRALLASELAVFVTWFTAIVIAGAVRRRGARNSFDEFLRSLGDPRRIFYGGLLAHAGILVLTSLVRGSDLAEPVLTALHGGGVAIFAAAVLGGAVYSVLRMTDNKIGLRLIGLLHPAADGLKTAFKEDIVPPGVDRLMHGIAPFISFFPALVVLAVVPFADTLCVGTTDGAHLDITKVLPSVPREGLCTEGAIHFQVVNLDVGILYFFALAGTGIVGAALGGWASNNKYSLLGGLRAASQMVSYEVTLGLTLIGAIMIYGTLRIDDMVRWQAQNAWGIFVQPLAFVLFFAAAVAESKRIPFDIPEGESEVVAGYFTEYAGMKFAMFFFSEYIAVVSSSALMAAVFLGGWHLPFVYRDGIDVTLAGHSLYQQALSHGLLVLLGFLAFLGKVVLLCWVQLTIRWTLPRFRYDQLMKLGWRMLLPASLINILVTGLVVLVVQGMSSTAVAGLEVLAQLTQALVAVAGIVALIAFVRLLLTPAEHRRMLASSSARYASAGTRRFPMGA